MQSMQRRFGKLLPRSADESQVAILLKDFDEADRMLQRVRLPHTTIELYNMLTDANSSLMRQSYGGTHGGIYWGLNMPLSASLICCINP